MPGLRCGGGHGRRRQCRAAATGADGLTLTEPMAASSSATGPSSAAPEDEVDVRLLRKIISALL